MSRARLWSRMYDYMRVRYILCPFPCPARPPPSASRTDGIPDAARWPTTHAPRPRPRGPVRSSPSRQRTITKRERQSALAPPGPARFPCGQGRHRRAPARGGCPLPACGEPMLYAHQTVFSLLSHCIYKLYNCYKTNGTRRPGRRTDPETPYIDIRRIGNSIPRLHGV